MAHKRQGKILPETLHPALTRAGIGSRGRLYIEKFAECPSDFVQTEDGLWLPPRDVAVRDRERGMQVLRVLAERQEKADMRTKADTTSKAVRILERSEVNSSGCFEEGFWYNQTAAKYLVALAEIDWGTPTFDELDDIPSIQICDTPDCANTRHYDFEFSRPTLRERRVDLREELYSELPDGSILTVWGDQLPPVEQSHIEFIQFMKRNYPYVPYGKSRLSATSTSQIRFIPSTGCWEAWQYYCKPDEGMNWQFDGYGRLYTRYKTKTLDYDTGEIIQVGRRGHWLAHRVVWAGTGRRLKPGKVLNHLCGYKRCCYPGHIEQVGHATNTAHGRVMQEAIRSLSLSMLSSN